ncbi:hypothetical protein E2C01_076909 [Portunus trituberculatus]|uniref:Uncharacterized protein n=1 Tax=Portunus trituberculatus TaxID=210409 RepID=A0A5B7IKB7_PORTR|nr:hypothetical protein [Portunus trituberculatus]
MEMTQEEEEEERKGKLDACIECPPGLVTRAGRAGKAEGSLQAGRDDMHSSGHQGVCFRDESRRGGIKSELVKHFTAATRGLLKWPRLAHLCHCGLRSFNLFLLQ